MNNTITQPTARPSEPLTFQAWYVNQPARLLPGIKKQIIDECKWETDEATNRCHRWEYIRTGGGIPTAIEQEIINRIAGTELIYKTL